MFSDESTAQTSDLLEVSFWFIKGVFFLATVTLGLGFTETSCIIGMWAMLFYSFPNLPK